MTSGNDSLVPLEYYPRIFFVGIGGISMSGLAEIAQASGHTVAGSDRDPTERTAVLAERGIQVFSGHNSARIDSFAPDLVVYSTAVPLDNPEIMRARELGIPTVDRSTFLGAINRTFERVINIAGTHGKTTTTAMCSLILIESKADPSVHLGAELRQFHGTIRLGQPGGLLISEACEYFRGFLRYYSTTAAVLNIDYDHVDCFANIDEVTDAFASFSSQLPESGLLVIPAFDPQVRIMVDRLAAERVRKGLAMPRLIWFGPAEETVDGREPDYCCRSLSYTNGLPEFDVWRSGRLFCRLQLKVPGFHNVVNALAAVACAVENGASAQDCVAALNAYSGAEGRFTETGLYRGARVIADYAHHPTAARATLAAAANIPHNRIWVVFQPLTFSRTKVLFNDFVDALRDIPDVILSEIYSDREKDRLGMSSRMIVERINALGGRAIFAHDFAEIRQLLDARVSPGDLILILGPENIRGFADQLTGRTERDHIA